MKSFFLKKWVKPSKGVFGIVCVGSTYVSQLSLSATRESTDLVEFSRLGRASACGTDVTPCLSPRMVSLQCCLLWLLLPLSSRTQKFPTRDEELFQMQIRDKAFFHDSAVIPDGAEISSYLFRDTPKRYLPTPLPLSMSA